MIQRRAIFLLLVATTMQLYAADWPTFRGNFKRTGYYAESVGYPSKNHVWVKNLGPAIISSPSIVDQTLYVGSQDSCIHALDARTGKGRWTRKTGGWVDASPLLNQESLIVGARSDTIYVLSKQNGDILATLKAGKQVSSPGMLADGTIITGLGPPYRQFAAYEPSNPKWEMSLPTWSVPFKQLSYSSPAISDNIIVIGAGDGKLYCIDATQKAIRWSVQTQGGVNISTPAIDNSKVFFAPGNYDKSVYAIDLLSGEILWTSSKPVKKRKRSKALHPFQFVQLLRLSPMHREQKIAQLQAQGISIPKALVRTKKRSNSSNNDFFPYGGMKTSSVTVDDYRVYVVQKDLGYPKPRFSCIALDKNDGRELWRFSELRNCIPLGYCSSPVVTKNTLITGWGEGKLYAFSPESGEKLWEDSLDGDIISSPTIADTRLYVATMKGNLYCYNLSETAPGESFKKSTYCYPNPARAGLSNIQVYVEKKATLSLVIYNTAEKPVYRTSKTIAAKEKFVYSWNLKNVANGVYFAIVRVKYSDGGEDKKILKIAVLN